MIPNKTLNKEFEYIKKKIEKNKKWESTLCKIAIYSYCVKGYKSMHQGKHVEACIIELLDALCYDNDGVETHTYYGNCDFFLHKLPISLKSSIKREGIWKADGTTYNQNFCKVFDTSRRPNNAENWKDTLVYLLKRVGWEIPILAYTFDVKLQKGVLFLTSLSEITQYKFGLPDKNDSEEFKLKMLETFHFNGSSHYSLSLQEAYYAAAKNKRVITFSSTPKKVKRYVQKKINQTIPIIEEIK